VIPEDAPLVTFGDINRGLWPDKFEPRSATIFSYALNNYWHTNFPRVQSGDFRFGYVVTSGTELTAAMLGRLGRDSLTPLETGELDHNDKIGVRGRLPETEGSFMELKGEGVELETLKPAEDGSGYVARLVETGGRAATTHLAGHLVEIERAWLADATEHREHELTVAGDGLDVALQANAIVTLRLQLRARQ
jgi:alpha-mannosidase